MLGNSPELIRKKYKDRELEATKILKRATTEIKAEVDIECISNPGPFLMLDRLMRTPPDRLHTVFEELQVDEENLYSQAAKALKRAAKQAMIVGVLTSLARACSGVASKPRRIPFDSLGLEKSLIVEKTFGEKIDLAARKINEGRDAAIIDILEHTQGETPLVRYRRNLVENRLQPDPAEARYSVISLPTRIEGVDLRLQYAEAEQIPKLSLIVRPLE